MRVKGLAMTHDLSIAVHADVEQHELRLSVAGCLTTDSHSSLIAVFRRACALEPLTSITIDLTEARHIEPAALVFLRTAVDQAERDGIIEPVVFRVPDQLPPCPTGIESAMSSEG